MAEPVDLILAMLADIRAEAARYLRESAERLIDIVNRLERIEAGQVSLTRALSFDTLMSRIPPGAFRDRVEARARWVTGQESHA